MRKLMVVLTLYFGFFGAPVMAGPGHGHGHSHGAVSKELASEKAMQKLAQLVHSGKIDASWSAIKPVSVEQKIYANGPEWVVSFKNDKLSDASKQVLYLFYSLDGHYIAANYTGE